MAHVYLSVGSNIERERYICAALDSLTEKFGELNISPVYESEAVGFSGDNFLNLVVAFDTELTVGQLSLLLREIEMANGRVRGQQKFSARTLDIDILTYGDAVGIIDDIALPRDEITERGFVIIPLADIAPDEILPGSETTYGQLAAGFDPVEHGLWVVELDWP
ncbi:MAG: 2-amino-4-hydroxy-6-hydroxymethyldihydropteridine diphosphokinase [Pseudomonadales bacterium]